jgi:hypothetical protein
LVIYYGRGRRHPIGGCACDPMLGSVSFDSRISGPSKALTDCALILLFSNHIKLKATRFNLLLGIFRLLGNNRCLRFFLVAKSAMSHSLMLTQLGIRLQRRVAQTASTRTDHSV